MTAPVSPDSSRLRLTVLLLVVGVLFIALLARLWYLQVINVKTARAAVVESGQVTILTPAPRGEILDREGQPLVTDVSVPVIEVLKSDETDTPLLMRLAALCGITLKQMQTKLDNSQYTPLEPVPVLEHASAQQILYVEENPALFGSSVTATTVSEPYVTALGEYAGNLLGYVGPIPASEVKTYEKEGYQATDDVGIGGVEQEFQSVLAGTPGRTVIQTNPQGQELSVLSQTRPVPGRNLRLTIDGALQKQAVLAMAQGESAARSQVDPYNTPVRTYKAPGGSVVAEDPKNGQLLALATSPTYDPNLFNGGISEANYAKLAPCAAVAVAQQQACEAANPADPLENRPIQGEYAPGSTFKLTTATAGLLYPQVTNVTPSWVYDDVGEIQLGNSVLHDDDDVGSGPVDLAQAITVSSDDYFYEIGIKLWDARAQVGQTAMQKVEEEYGFGKDTGIDLPDENAGVVPTPALYAQEFKEYPKDFETGTWYSGDSAHTAIGQGQVLVTPLQLANAYATFANGGTRYVPQLALDAQSRSGKTVKTYAPKVAGHSPALSPPDRQAILQGFEGVVQSGSGSYAGTAYTAFAGTPLTKDDIAGKTGTAQTSSPGQQDTSVFTSFAPASDPDIVVDCLMEDAGYGASLAAPIVRSVYQQWYGDPVTPVTYEGGVSGAQG